MRQPPRTVRTELVVERCNHGVWDGFVELRLAEQDLPIADDPEPSDVDVTGEALERQTEPTQGGKDALEVTASGRDLEVLPAAGARMDEAAPLPASVVDSVPTPART